MYIPYAEGPFMLLAVASFLLARRGQWAGAALLAGLASGVRITGVFLAVALAVEYLHQRGWQWRRIGPDATWLLLAPLGLLAYMGYLWIEFTTRCSFTTSRRAAGSDSWASAVSSR